MKVAIIGSKSIKDEQKVIPTIAKFIKEHTHGTVSILINGYGGVNVIAGKYGKHLGVDVVTFFPIFALDKTVEFNPKHLITNNKQIIDNCDKLLAIWDGESKGTEHAIKYARHMGIPVMVVKV